MAITGTGTQLDPWLVHSYSEINAVISTHDYATTAGKYYIKLNQDINCNDYGETFEWETVTTSADSIVFDFDLGGHVIKNIKVSAGHLLFRGMSVDGTGDWVIHDGKILNVFLENAVGFSAPPTVWANAKAICYRNVSISVDGTGATGIIFDGAFFDRVALYFISLKIVSPILSYYVGSNTVTIEDSDIYTSIADLNSVALAENRSNYAITLLNCRLTGIVKGVPFLSSMSGIYYYRAIWGNGKVKLQSCCCSINTVDCNIQPIWGNVNMLAYISENMSNLNNVVNKSIMHETYPADQLYDCTAEEIVNGASLREHGFIVVNVAGE